jgi:tRNA(Glu) U13 pseudouridine synthase TruD
MHLYAFQSYLWNQALSLFLLHRLEKERQVKLSSELGRLIAWRDLAGAEELRRASLPLPAGDLELPRGDRRGTLEERLASALHTTLAQERLRLEELRLPRATGMAFKAEPRPIAIVPEGVAVGEPTPDPDNPGGFVLELSFALPRGCYATVVLERLRAW